MDTASPLRSNRRLTARVACHLTVSYRTGRDWHPASALDLSRRGCRLRLGEGLKRGGAVTVRLEAPSREAETPAAAEVRGVVIWSRLEGLSYQTGIQFDGEPAELHAILLALG